jgi:hypothetical protein
MGAWEAEKPGVDKANAPAAAPRSNDLVRIFVSSSAVPNGGA